MPERDPAFTPRCLKCGSDSIVPDARLIDRGHGNDRQPSEVGVETKPDAWVLKGEVRVPTRVQVCGDCGFVETYVTDPHRVWEAHVERAARQLDGERPR